MEKNIVGTINYEGYKDVLFNKKYFEHSRNSIQSKNNMIGTSEINIIFS